MQMLRSQELVILFLCSANSNSTASNLLDKPRRSLHNKVAIAVRIDLLHELRIFDCNICADKIVELTF